MAAYTRQTTFVDTATIEAADHNNEFNALEAAFAVATGHAHDGSAGEGPIINVIGDAALATPLNKVLIDTLNDNIGFWIDVASSSVEQITLSDGVFAPVNTNDIDLGTSLLEFKDAHFTGTVNIGAGVALASYNDLSDVASAATARTNLGVDAAGTDNSTDVTLAGSLDYITLIGQEITRNAVVLTTDVSGVLPVANGGTGASTLTDGGVLLGSGTGAITAMGVLADGEMIVGDGTTDPVAESGATLRASIGVDAAGTDNSTDVTVSGAYDYITLSGQDLVRGQVDLTTDVTGTLPIGNGGTGGTTAAAARIALDVDAAGTDNSTDVTVSGTPNYITLSGQDIVRAQIDLTTDVTGVLPVANGGVPMAVHAWATVSSAGVITGGSGVTSSTSSGGGFIVTLDNPVSSIATAQVYATILEDPDINNKDYMYLCQAGFVTTTTLEVATVRLSWIAALTATFVARPFQIIVYDT